MREFGTRSMDEAVQTQPDSGPKAGIAVGESGSGPVTFAGIGKVHTLDKRVSPRPDSPSAPAAPERGNRHFPFLGISPRVAAIRAGNRDNVSVGSLPIEPTQPTAQVAGQAEVQEQPRGGILDPDVFVQRIGEHGSVIYGIALRRLGNHHDAEDAVQTVLAKAWQARERYTQRPGVPLEAWLNTITVNTITDLRWKETAQHHRRNLTAEGEVPNPRDAYTRVGNPDEERQIIALGQRLLAAGISQRRVQLLALRLSGASPEDIAAQLNIKVGSVKSGLHKGKDDVRRIVQGNAARIFEDIAPDELPTASQQGGEREGKTPRL